MWKGEGGKLLFNNCKKVFSLSDFQYKLRRISNENIQKDVLVY